jgi:diguanylate cyclase
MNGDSDSAQWKQKYFDSLEELEAKENQWKSLETLLRQLVSRLTLAADQSEPDLVKQLDQLRQEIRSNISIAQLQTRFEGINQGILGLDERRKQRQRSLDIASGLSEVLEKVDLPQGIRRKGIELQKRLARSSPDSDPGPLLDDFAALFTESLDWLKEEADENRPESESTESGTGIFGRIFTQKGADKDQQADIELAKTLLERAVQKLQVPAEHRAEQNRLISQLDKADNPQALQEWGERLQQWTANLQTSSAELSASEALIQLLERLDLPSELAEDAERLKLRIDGEKTVASLTRSMTDIADLIARARSQVQQEKNEIEAFLSDLTDRLTQIDESLETTFQGEREAAKQRMAFGDKVNEEVKGIETSVHEAQDLDTLKMDIRSRIDAIQAHMDAYRKIETDREERSSSEIKELSAQLDTFQTEVTTLHKKLEQAREAATIDALTSLPNRMAYEERIAEEIERARRYQRPLSLAIIDVDFFKKINDQFGHPAGDKVLKILADVFRKRTRDSDFTARMGGEEFMLVLTETDADDALGVTDKLRGVIEQANFHFRDTRVPVTVSCGITDFCEGDSAEDLYSRADEALYEAKEGGRNRCVLKKATF